MVERELLRILLLLSYRVDSIRSNYLKGIFLIIKAIESIKKRNVRFGRYRSNTGLLKVVHDALGTGILGEPERKTDKKMVGDKKGIDDALVEALAMNFPNRGA